MSADASYFQIDVNHSVPLYHQIQENITELMTLGILKEGEALPSERELSEYYGVNRMTVRQAIDVLVNKGRLRKIHGVGTFVKQPVQAPFAPTLMGFTQRMREAGLTPSSRLLHFSVVQPKPKVYFSLKLSAADQVICVRRLRLVNNEPLMVETSYLPYSRFPDFKNLDIENASLYELLHRHYKTQIMEAEQTLEPTLLNEDEAVYLNLPLGQPAMLVQTTAYDTNHVPFEFSKSVVRGDRCQYYFHITIQRPITF